MAVPIPPGVSRPPKPTKTPKAPVPVITDRSQNKARSGDRGWKIEWDLSTSGPSRSIFSDTGKTNNYAVHNTQIPSPPAGTVAAIVLVIISSDTTTAGTGHVDFYPDLAGANGTVAQLSWNNYAPSVTNRFSVTLIVPVVGGCVVWDTTTSGATNYNLSMTLCGYIVA